MATLFDDFSALSKSARAALPFIQRGVAQGLSANQILAAVKAEDIGLRRQTGLDIIASLKQSASATQLVRVVPPSTVVHPSNFAIYPGNLKTNFRYNAFVRMRDPETGELVKQNVTISSNDALSRQQVEDTAAGYAESGKYGEGLEITEIVVTDIFKSASYGG